MKKNTLETPENSFVFVIPDDAKTDRRGFYKTDSASFKKANPDIDFEYLAHDLKYRGLDSDNDFYERNGVKLPKVKYEAKLLREPLKANSDDWNENAHKWLIIINDQTFEYYTGLAHRVPNKHDKKEYDRLTGWNVRLTDHGLNNLLSFSKAKPPTIEDVLYCLLSDSDANSMSFSEWCDMFGYDNDSLKARKTYDACQENADKLAKAGIYNNEDMQKYFEDF